MSAPTQLATLQASAVAPVQQGSIQPGFGSLQSFELIQRAAKVLMSSTLVPAAYRHYTEKKRGQEIDYIENPNALANCVVALNMANRMGADPLMVMQNLYIVEGRPSWSSQWIIAAINGCGRFSPLRFDLKDLGEKEVEYTVTEWVDRQRVNKKVRVKVRNLECVAWAIEKDTKDRIDSPRVSIEMAVQEGWYGKNGSKWQTMPEVMLRYRTASFFGKLYAPELLMGLQTVEEMHDVIDITPTPEPVAARPLAALQQAPSAEPVEQVEQQPAEPEGDAPATAPEPQPANQPREEAQPEQQAQPERQRTQEDIDFERSVEAERTAQAEAQQSKPAARARGGNRPPISAD